MKGSSFWGFINNSCSVQPSLLITSLKKTQEFGTPPTASLPEAFIITSQTPIVDMHYMIKPTITGSWYIIVGFTVINLKDLNKNMMLQENWSHIWKGRCIMRAYIDGLNWRSKHSVQTFCPKSDAPFSKRSSYPEPNKLSC